MQSEIPPVKNRILYIYRIIIKILSFALFGIGTIIVVTTIFPVMRLLLHPKERFQKYGRIVIFYTMRFFVRAVSITCVVKIDIDNRIAYRNLSSKIIVANHPSLLDVVMLLSLIPNAVCIFKGYLSHHIIKGIIEQLYIPNYLDFDILTEACANSLRQGNCIIIFPEGTRTPRSGNVKLKKGAARLSLSSGCSIVPVHIGGTDKYGLGKHDPFLSFNHTDKYIFSIRMKDEILPSKYADAKIQLAAKYLTEDIKNILFNQENN